MAPRSGQIGPDDQISHKKIILAMIDFFLIVRRSQLGRSLFYLKI